jgi:hypothetical protein
MKQGKNLKLNDCRMKHGWQSKTGVEIRKWINKDYYKKDI